MKRTTFDGWSSFEMFTISNPTLEKQHWINLDVACNVGDVGGYVFTVDAPFYNSPREPSSTASGQSCPGLWDYEGERDHATVGERVRESAQGFGQALTSIVVEAFFLGADNSYLEVELCPYVAVHLNDSLTSPRVVSCVSSSRGVSYLNLK